MTARYPRVGDGASWIDRAGDQRTDPGLLAAALADPSTRVVSVRAGALSVVDVPAGLTLHLVPPSAVPHDLLVRREPWIFLGRLVAPGGPAAAPEAPACLAVVLPDGAGPEGGTMADLRVALARLSAPEAEIALQATALAIWHATHPRCPRCGAATESASTGWTRRCLEDGSEHYPRTDPAVIVAVVDDRDRILLGHAARREEGWFSTLAGFVEPGETPEQAVRREVAEESGVLVGDVSYAGSQPWPFPASLMLGFTARATTTRIRVDGEEITEARWFSREQLGEGVRSGELRIPGPTSIARRLIEGWFGGPLPDPA